MAMDGKGNNHKAAGRPDGGQFDKKAGQGSDDDLDFDAMDERLSRAMPSLDHEARRRIIDSFFGQALDGSARIEDLCEQVHISPSSLNRVIRELYGTSFKQKLIESRIAYIKYYLKYTDFSIRAVAEKTGFAEDNRLSLFFKQHAGQSPTQYRLQERTTPPEPE